MDDETAVEVERADRVIETFWPAATNGSASAIEIVLLWMERKARFLGWVGGGTASG